MANKHEASTVIFCGDLTDAKDRHPSTLVNRLVGELDDLAADGIQIWLLKGNHDYISEANPFFDFMSRIPHIQFITTAYKCRLDNSVSALFLPSTRNYEAVWKSLDNLADLIGEDVKSLDYIFCHQTFDGSIAENGTALRGIPPSFFKGFRGKVISGDIHVPQDINKQITHVGSPYHVHFGDTFEPRVLLIDGNRWTDLHFPCISREVVDVTATKGFQQDFPKGTQIKIRVHLKRQEFGEKEAIREALRRIADIKGYVLCGVEWKLKQVHGVREEVSKSGTVTKPTDVVKAYAKEKKLSKELTALGVEFVKEAV